MYGWGRLVVPACRTPWEIARDHGLERDASRVAIERPCGVSEAHHAPIVQRVIERRAREYQPVDQRHRDRGGAAAREAAQQTAGVTAVQVEDVRRGRVVVVRHRDHVRLPALDEPHVRHEPGSEDRLCLFGDGPLRMAPQSGPRWRRDRGGVHQRFRTIRRGRPVEATSPPRGRAIHEGEPGGLDRERHAALSTSAMASSQVTF